MQYLQHLRFISKKLICLYHNPGKKELSMERQIKKDDYVCFACRRDLFFCSLIFYWEIPSNIFFNSEKFSHRKCNIVWNISNTLAPVSLNYNKNIFCNLSACWRCWKNMLVVDLGWFFSQLLEELPQTRKSVIHMAWILFCLLGFF